MIFLNSSRGRKREREGEEQGGVRGRAETLQTADWQQATTLSRPNVSSATPKLNCSTKRVSALLKSKLRK